MPENARISPQTGHRLFSHITMNWRGRPLTGHEVIVNSIAATTTRTGLTVRAELDPGSYPTGTEISDAQMAAVPLARADRRPPRRARPDDLGGYRGPGAGRGQGPPAQGPRLAQPGRDARREFEYVRHGTISIIAAMNVTTGEVITERIHRNDSAAFTGFLAMLHQMIPPHLRIHLIMDNGSSHTSRVTRAWLAAHPRFAVTYTPKHASWLNMIGQWLGVLTRRVLRRGDFASRDDLEAKITAFAIRHNKTARPYRWGYDVGADHARYLERHPSPNPCPPSR
jgi:transposase